MSVVMLAETGIIFPNGAAKSWQNSAVANAAESGAAVTLVDPFRLGEIERSDMAGE